MPTTDLFKFVSVRPAELSQDRKPCEYIVDDRIGQDSFSVRGDDASVPLSPRLESTFDEIRKVKKLGLKDVNKENADCVKAIKRDWDRFLQQDGGETLLNKESEFLSQVRKVLENHIGNYRPDELFGELQEKYQAYWRESTSSANKNDPPSLITLLSVPSENRSISELLHRNFNALYVAYILKRRWPVNLEPRIQHLQTLHTLRIFVADYCHKLSKRKGCLDAFSSFLPTLLKWAPRLLNALRNTFFGTSEVGINPSSRIEPIESDENGNSGEAHGEADVEVERGADPEADLKGEGEAGQKGEGEADPEADLKAEGEADQEGEGEADPEADPPKYITTNRMLIAAPLGPSIPFGVSTDEPDRAETDVPEREFCPAIPCPVNSGEDLQRLLNSQPVIPSEFAYLFFSRNPYNPIKPVGIGDLKVVKQEIREYVAGEVAHIENVLKGEFKERSHRRLNRAEDIFVSETEKIEEEERELQTTDQFELQKEVESVIQTDMSVEAGVTVTGGFGPVEITAYGDFAYSRSKEDSRRSASNFSKEVVDRSLKRVQTRVREERTRRRITEIEEINKHGIDNRKQSKHISGIYRFVDKKYESQVYNYGKRLMFEFVVPEPGEFYASAQRNLPREELPPLKEPKAPELPELRVSEINQSGVDDDDQSGVDYWSAKCNLTNLTPEPEEEITINDGFSQIISPNLEDASFEKAIQIPQNYYVEKAIVGISAIPNRGVDNAFIMVTLGNTLIKGIWWGEGLARPLDLFGILKVEGLGEEVVHFEFGDAESGSVVFSDETALADITGKIVASAITNDILAFSVTTTIWCKREDTYYREWQIDTYNKIVDAYTQKYQEYLSDKAAYEALKQSRESEASQVQITGRNPRINQEIIKEELKKQCISIIAKQFDTVEWDEERFNAMQNRNESVIIGWNEDGSENLVEDTPIPTLAIKETLKEGRLIQFFEQAFDWGNITYVLYPYFWGRIKKWYEQYQHLDENDYLFGAFLRAGAARVLISVKPHYETAVMHYLYTGEVWNGGPAPVIGDDLYIPIHEELRNQQDDLQGGTPEGEPWEYIVPTPLIYLQEGSELPKFKS